MLATGDRIPGPLRPFDCGVVLLVERAAHIGRAENAFLLFLVHPVPFFQSDPVLVFLRNELADLFSDITAGDAASVFVRVGNLFPYRHAIRFIFQPQQLADVGLSGGQNRHNCADFRGGFR